MEYLELNKIIADMKTNPSFAGIPIFDDVPDKEPADKPYIILTVISDPITSPAGNRARVEARVILGKASTPTNSRTWYKLLNDYFVGNVKMFGDEEVWKVEMEDRKLFPDEYGNRVVLIDYYMYYLS